MVPASTLVCFTVVTVAHQAPARPARAAATPRASSPVTYRVTIPEPEHHWLQVEATFPDVGSKPLDVHMSRSSPGRYALHEFAKNVFSFAAFDGRGTKLTTTRPSPYEWSVAGHDGTVRVVYRLFGDLADGTYLAVNTSHAHMNMPATFMWAEGLEERPALFTFANPAGHDWNIATQLYPTSDPLTFTAPNLQYFMDSPTEFSNFVVSTFDLPNADGKPAHFRVVAHSDGSQADVDELAKLIKRIATEDMQVFGEFPQYEPSSYTFLLDYMPSNAPDGMEHRNSTVITEPGAPSARGVTLRTPQGREAALDAISHEFFHSWNVERIRPAGLEPFDFTRANITCCLWLAEGFTQYYGRLQLFRAGLLQRPPVNAPAAVINGSGRMVRSAVEMSEWAAFADAARSVDPTDQSRSFISYYTYGSAIALALDLSIREVSSGRLSLDDYMKLLWKLHGKPGGPAPGLVGRPYSLKDVRDHLAELTGNRRFADDFFDGYIEGRDVADYTHLLSLAGYVVRKTNPERAWLGGVQVEEQAGGLIVASGGGGRGGAPGATLVPFGTPIYDAGVEGGDVITMIDGAPATMTGWTALSARKIGDKVALTVRHRDGTTVTRTAVLKADPSIQTAPIENGGTLTDAQRALRQSWLGTKVK
jgi:predicted metalloprotease with PDZ domain